MQSRMRPRLQPHRERGGQRAHEHHHAFERVVVTFDDQVDELGCQNRQVAAGTLVGPGLVLEADGARLVRVEEGGVSR